jgi:uncharacterized protein (DUF697 family)
MEVRKVAGEILPRARQLAPQAANTFFRTVVETAMDGRGRFLGARAYADRELAKANGDIALAVSAIIEQHVAYAGGQGFVTSLGGLILLPISMPANLAGLAILQVRMVGAIAHLRGYDVDESRVRTAVTAVLLGEDAVEDMVKKGKLPSTPLAIATAPVHDPELDRKLATEISGALSLRVGGKRLGLVAARRIPLLGGGVGAVVDGVETYRVGKYAEKALPRRNLGQIAR